MLLKKLYDLVILQFAIFCSLVCFEERKKHRPQEDKKSSKSYAIDIETSVFIKHSSLQKHSSHYCLIQKSTPGITDELV